MTRDLSALETAILGLVDQIGPATPYTVRRVFEASPSSHWSGSSGAVYPAVRRLEKTGLLIGKARPGDQRGTKEYRLSEEGRAALLAWLASEVEASEAAYVFDPIRLRVLFMDALPLDRRRALVEDALEKLRALRDVEEAFGSAMSRAGSSGARRANRGAVLVLNARIEWLEELASEMTDGPGA